MDLLKQEYLSKEMSCEQVDAMKLAIEQAKNESMAMKVEEAKERIMNIDTCQDSLNLLFEKEKDPYWKDVFKISKNLLGEYKKSLVDMIENAETN